MFARTRAAGRMAIIPYLTVGYPNKGDTPELARRLIEAGADGLELGIPFSDPVADGPTIQATGQRALENGVTPTFALEVAAECRRLMGPEAPIVFMTYFNPILKYGLERFCADAAAAGVDGIIVPDLPPDEAAELTSVARPAGLDTIQFAAPTTTDERLRALPEHTSGFIYLVSLTGVTGARRDLSADLPDLIAQIRRHTDLPICVGFGISTPDHVRALSGHADGVIFASRLLDILTADGPAAAAAFVTSLRDAAEPAPAPA